MHQSRRTRTIVLALSAASIAGSLSVAPAGAATTATYRVGASSTKPLPATVPADRVPCATGGVTAAASTPDGFKLHNPGYRRSDYIYDSDTVYQGTYRCGTSGTCYLLAQVAAQLHQVAIGGSSHTWQLTMNMKNYSNPGGLTWSYSATYWCGVNVSLGNDTICTNGAAPSNATMSVNTLVNKPWGSTNGIKVFPMVQASTLFSNGVRVSTKFRGCDTLSRSSTTRLAASSDG